MNRLAIFGASGHGSVVADAAELGGWEIIDFYDDKWPTVTSNGAWKVVGDSESLHKTLPEYDGVIVALGDNVSRRKVLLALRHAGAKLTSIIHPSAVVSRHSNLSEGSVVCAGAVINAGARLGIGAIVNTCSSVDHDCVISEFVHISPGARLAGGVRVGVLSWIGIGSTVKQMITIGNGVIVAAGAVVIQNVPDDVVVAGVPATILQRDS